MPDCSDVFDFELGNQESFSERLASEHNKEQTEGEDGQDMRRKVFAGLLAQVNG